tara:strand:+ start:310 stop:1350 length:1041 start_codon:yes stop_codon:yes gene_type:complete
MVSACEAALRNDVLYGKRTPTGLKLYRSTLSKSGKSKRVSCTKELLNKKKMSPNNISYRNLPSKKTGPRGRSGPRESTACVKAFNEDTLVSGRAGSVSRVYKGKNGTLKKAPCTRELRNRGLINKYVPKPKSTTGKPRGRPVGSSGKSSACVKALQNGKLVPGKRAGSLLRTYKGKNGSNKTKHCTAELRKRGLIDNKVIKPKPTPRSKSVYPKGTPPCIKAWAEGNLSTRNGNYFFTTKSGKEYQCTSQLIKQGVINKPKPVPKVNQRELEKQINQTLDEIINNLNKINMSMSKENNKKPCKDQSKPECSPSEWKKGHVTPNGCWEVATKKKGAGHTKYWKRRNA